MIISNTVESTLAICLARCVAVLSVSFKPSGASARGHWAKWSKKVGVGGLLLFLLLFAQCPHGVAPLGLKETEMTATQATICQAAFYVGYAEIFDVGFQIIRTRRIIIIFGIKRRKTEPL